MPQKERPSFEEALKMLEEIVEELKNDEITLEKSVELYEKGLELSNICSETLDQASLKIKQIDTSNKNELEN